MELSAWSVSKGKRKVSNCSLKWKSAVWGCHFYFFLEDSTNNFMICYRSSSDWEPLPPWELNMLHRPGSFLLWRFQFIVWAEPTAFLALLILFSFGIEMAVTELFVCVLVVLAELLFGVVSICSYFSLSSASSPLSRFLSQGAFCSKLLFWFPESFPISCMSHQIVQWCNMVIMFLLVPGAASFSTSD